MRRYTHRWLFGFVVVRLSFATFRHRADSRYDTGEHRTS